MGNPKTDTIYADDGRLEPRTDCTTSAFLRTVQTREEWGDCNNMPKPNRNMCNKHLLWRTRLLRLVLEFRLHDSYRLHRFDRHVRILHRRSLLNQRSNTTPFTSTAFHSLGMTLSSSSNTEDVTYTVAATQEPLTTPTSSSAAPSPNHSKPGIGIIVGSTIGACLFASFIAFVVFLAWRRRRAVRRNGVQAHTYQPTPQTMVEYNPLGFPSPVFSSPASPYHDDFKGWQQEQSTQRNFEVPQYPGMGQGRLGIVEVDGFERPVEAPTAEK
ncbi:hypothetical protein PTNB29_04874 [Pyrenophora teres f. teres]|nr:hypothetical protein PTNB29_04874 [Pyrenophora teres f. teres]